MPDPRFPLMTFRSAADDVVVGTIHELHAIVVVRQGTAPGVDRLLDYELLDELGRGWMGVVYNARQKALNRIVALKMVLSGGRASKVQLARFTAEARAVAKLDHPNIVQVYDIGEHDGLPFFAMEFVEGGALDALVKKQSLEPLPAARLMALLCRAMHYAHTKGIIHRDLKPANILIVNDAVKSLPSTKSGGDKTSLGTGTGTGQHAALKVTGTGQHAALKTASSGLTPKITDFGLAKQLDDDADHATRTGAVMGTPNYMAPEQAEGNTIKVNHLSDVYSLGATLYELITGRPPFQGPSVMSVLSLVRSADPVNPSRLQPGIPRDLETICLKAMQKEPGKRYDTAELMAEDLERFIDGQPILARPISSIEKLARWDLSLPLYGLGFLHDKLGNKARSTQSYRECLRIREKLLLESDNLVFVRGVATAAARLGEHAKAMRMIDAEEKRTPSRTNNAAYLYDAAATASISAFAIGQGIADDKLNPDERKLCESYLAKAWEFVARVHAASPAKAREVASDPDFEFLQARPKFAETMDGILKKGTGAP
jgi:serine/threonine protein kinase